MRLTDLDPEWVFDFNAETHGHRRARDAHSIVRPGRRTKGKRALTVVNAQGVLFLCPVCFKKNGGPVGTESVLCWFKDRGVPDAAEPGPGRWTATGTGFGDLTLTPSVNVDNEHWHGFVTNGEVTNA